MANKKEITELTPAQKELMEVRKKEWEAISKDCSPADWKRGEDAVTRLYEILGKKRPKFVRVSSPFAAQIIINAFTAVFLPDAKSNKESPADREDLAEKFAGLKGNVMMDLHSSLDREKIPKQDKIAKLALEYLDRKVKITFVNTSLWGQQDAYWVAFYKFCEEIGVEYEKKDSEILQLWSEVCHSHMWWWAYEEYCFVCDRPLEIHFNEQGRLHNTSGPAVLFRDGYKMYGVNGIRIEDWVIEHPERLTPALCMSESNAEIRRVKIDALEDHFGAGTFISKAGAKVIKADEWGRLLKIDLPDDEPMVMVEVLNSSMEEDGVTQKRFFIRVPERGGANLSHGENDPEIKTPKQAIAWTFGKLEKDYDPAMES